MSHVGMFSIPNYDKLIILTDGGMLVSPDVDQKEKIINNAVETLHNMGYENPKVAVLCAAEKLNAKAQESVDAAELKERNLKGDIKGCVVEGPISYDIALSKEIADFKGYQSPVAGECDILLAPNIHAGNIMGKMMSVLCNSRLGGFLVGTTHPVIFSSRGSSSDEKFVSICLAAISALNMQ